MKQLRGLYVQTFFTFRTTLYLASDLLLCDILSPNNRSVFVEYNDIHMLWILYRCNVHRHRVEGWPTLIKHTSRALILKQRCGWWQ